MVNGYALKNIQMAIYDYIGFFGQEWGPLCGAATLAIIPILLVFTFLGKQLVSGLTAGSSQGLNRRSATSGCANSRCSSTFLFLCEVYL